jgi:hypothetical protein
MYKNIVKLLIINDSQVISAAADICVNKYTAMKIYKRGTRN